MKRFNNAFTLTELLVALGVIGILCAILLPVIFNLLPNQNTIMAKRAYYTVQTVVSDLINDEGCYPDKTNSTTGRRVGFDDGFGYANCSAWGGDENTGTITAEGDANSKFIKLFTDKIDIASGNNTQKFTTKDGISWAFPTMGYQTKNNKNAIAILVVDVNGKDKPNCGKAATSALDMGDGVAKTVCTADRTSGFDVFSMGIYADGRITINAADTWAINAVKVNKDITEE